MEGCSLRDHQSVFSSTAFYSFSAVSHFKSNTCIIKSSPYLVARLQDGLSSALSRRCVQSDAALLAVQPQGAAKVLRTAAGPCCHQKEVMPSLFVPFKRI